LFNFPDHMAVLSRVGTSGPSDTAMQIQREGGEENGRGSGADTGSQTRCL